MMNALYPQLGTTPHISVVDDDISIRESLRGMFRSMGFGVYAFASAEEFLSVEENRDTNCLILDIGMPGMSGLDLQRTLTTKGTSIPIIFITARDNSDLRAKAVEGGAIAYLVKPFSDDALLNAVQTAVSDR